MSTIETTIKLNDRFTSTLKHMNNALNSLINSMDDANKASNNIINPSSISSARNELNKANASIQNIEESINESNNAQQKLNNSAKNGSGIFNSLKSQVTGLVAAYASWQGVQSLVNAGDAYIGNTARIDLMNDGLQTTAELQQKIYEASQRSLTGYNDLTNIVAKLGITAKDAFANNDEMIAFGELMQKQFAIAGTGVQEKNAAMYQLTQAMASGRLQGDEFRSILENAPMLAKTISDYMGMTMGQLREASSEGKITADIIKNALFSTAEETNKKFSNMPMTWGDLWVQMTNKVNRGLEPLYLKLRDMWNNPNVQTFLNGLVNGFLMLSQVGISAFEMLSSLFTLAYNNWSLLEPIVWSLVSALGVYFAIQTAGLIKTIAQWVMATAVVVGHQIALFVTTAAQWGLNAALAACPLTWIIYGVIAIVGAFYLAVAAINKFAGTSISATGVVVGAFKTLGAFLWNLFLGFSELIVGIFQYLVNPIIAFVNFFGNVFNSPISSIINLFSDLADNCIGVLERIASAMDFVFGSNMASTVSGWRKGLKSLAEEKIKEYAVDENYKEIISKMDFSMDDMSWAKRLDYGDSFNSGYEAGEKFNPKDALSGVLDTLGFKPNMDGGLGSIGSAMKNANMPMLDKLGKIADNTAITNDTLSMNNEDMSYLRDLAERESINKFTSPTNNITMNNNNNVSSKIDLDDMVSYLQEKIYNTMLSSAEGSHY